MFPPEEKIIIRCLGCRPYLITWQAMREWTDQRDDQTRDEIWLLEHEPVFTQGQNGKPEHILDPHDIPVIKTDRGGQVTYHGPGQLMIYTLIDLKRKKLPIREFVTLLEQAMIDLLTEYNIRANALPKAPGIYVNKNKIASIGLRVRRGCTYHGIAFNVAMNLEPFSWIHPCGFKELQMTQLTAHYHHPNTQEIGKRLIHYLMKKLRYTTVHYLENNAE